MNVAVRYYSKSGNTAKIAEAVAQAAGTQALPIADGLKEPVDLLFLGGAPYAFHLAKPLRTFIAQLRPADVKTVCVFSTSGSPLGASQMIAKKCREAGLDVLEQEFHCVGSRADLAEEKEKAQKFARAVIEEQTGISG